MRKRQYSSLPESRIAASPDMGMKNTKTLILSQYITLSGKNQGDLIKMGNMKTISINELSDYISRERPSQYVYDSDNQVSRPDRSFLLVSRFESLQTSNNPDCILLRTGGVSLCLTDIRKITISEHSDISKAILQVRCGRSPYSDDTICHTVLID